MQKLKNLENVVAEKTMFGSIDAAGVAFSNGAFTAQRHNTKAGMYIPEAFGGGGGGLGIEDNQVTPFFMSPLS